LKRLLRPAGAPPPGRAAHGFSELAICGYPPADFLEKPSFLARCRTAVDELAEATSELPTAVLAGVALPPRGRAASRP
jgi:NAD+ synthase (glutamine-hydrolysing)